MIGLRVPRRSVPEPSLPGQCSFHEVALPPFQTGCMMPVWCHIIAGSCSGYANERERLHVQMTHISHTFLPFLYYQQMGKQKGKCC